MNGEEQQQQPEQAEQQQPEQAQYQQQAQEEYEQALYSDIQISGMILKVYSKYMAQLPNRGEYINPFTEDIVVSNLRGNDLKICRQILDAIIKTVSFAVRYEKDLSSSHNELVMLLNSYLLTSRGDSFSAALLSKTQFQEVKQRQEYFERQEQEKKGLKERLLGR